MEAITLISALALIWKAVDFVKYIKAGEWNGVITQATAWVAGIGVAFLCSEAEISETWDVGGIILGTLDGPSVILVGLIWASGASALVDFKKARDNTDSAAVPSLVTPSPEDTAPR